MFVTSQDCISVPSSTQFNDFKHTYKKLDKSLIGAKVKNFK